MKIPGFTLALALSFATIGQASAGESPRPELEPTLDEEDTAGGGARVEAAHTLPPILPSPEPFELSDGELEAFVKRFAADVALALTTYDADDDVDEIVRRFPLASNEAAVEDAIRSLHHPASWSRGRIVYPQFGGLLPEQASVMVVVEQRIGSAAGIRSETRTLDVRVSLREGDWHFERLASHGGDPVPRPETLSPEALAVLDNPHIELPDSARWDIHAGLVSPALLDVMARAAEEWPIGVIAFHSGHPWHIFGTDRMSDHSRGIAVDIHRIGDRLVIDDRAEDSTTRRFVEWLFEQRDVAVIGSPWALDGFGGRSFTDLLHQDHIHLAVSREHAIHTD